MRPSLASRRHLLTYSPSSQPATPVIDPYPNLSVRFQPKPRSPAPTSLDLLRAKDVSPQPVEWLWPGRIPIGKITLILGNSGLGKSLLTLDIASRVSRSAPWPDQDAHPFNMVPPRTNDKGQGTPDDGLSPAAHSVIICACDHEVADTIRPRLDAHNADCDRVFIFPSLFDLHRDFDQLQLALKRHPDCRLIIFDPINAYVPPYDLRFYTLLRKVLDPLVRFASGQRIAILATSHFANIAGSAYPRSAGALGLLAAARTAWTACRDPANPDRRLLLPLKSSLATAGGLAYTIESQPGTGAPLIRWCPEPVELSPHEALAPRRGPQPALLNEACNWLRQELSKRDCRASELIVQGSQKGFSPASLRRAIHAIGGHIKKKSDLLWWWSLPDRTAPATDN